MICVAPPTLSPNIYILQIKPFTHKINEMRLPFRPSWYTISFMKHLGSLCDNVDEAGGGVIVWMMLVSV